MLVKALYNCCILGFETMLKIIAFHELRVVAEEHGKSEKLYWLFSWKNKRSGWLNSNAPIFLDFGDESLYLVKKYTSLSDNK